MAGPALRRADVDRALESWGAPADIDELTRLQRALEAGDSP